MKIRRVIQSLATAILAVGLFSAGVAAPAQAGSTTPSHSTNDTGWDRV
jgi:hypothetical protein